MCVLVGDKIDKRFAQRRDNGSLVSMNAYEVISLALHPYVLGIIPEQVLFVVICCSRYNTKNNFQHAIIFRIRCRTHHEVQVLSEQAESFYISSVIFYSSNALGLINRVNPSVTNRNCKDEEIRQQKKATCPVVVLKDYDPPVATVTLLFYILVVIMTRYHPLVTSAFVRHYARTSWPCLKTQIYYLKKVKLELSVKEETFVRQSLATQAIPSPKLLIKDHKTIN